MQTILRRFTALALIPCLVSQMGWAAGTRRVLPAPPSTLECFTSQAFAPEEISFYGRLVPRFQRSETFIKIGAFFRNSLHLIVLMHTGILSLPAGKGDTPNPLSPMDEAMHQFNYLKGRPGWQVTREGSSGSQSATAALNEAGGSALFRLQETSKGWHLLFIVVGESNEARDQFSLEFNRDERTVYGEAVSSRQGEMSRAAHFTTRGIQDFVPQLSVVGYLDDMVLELPPKIFSALYEVLNADALSEQGTIGLVDRILSGGFYWGPDITSPACFSIMESHRAPVDYVKSSMDPRREDPLAEQMDYLDDLKSPRFREPRYNVNDIPTLMATARAKNDLQMLGVAYEVAREHLPTLLRQSTQSDKADEAQRILDSMGISLIPLLFGDVDELSNPPAPMFDEALEPIAKAQLVRLGAQGAPLLSNWFTALETDSAHRRKIGEILLAIGEPALTEFLNVKLLFQHTMELVAQFRDIAVAPLTRLVLEHEPHLWQMALIALTRMKEPRITALQLIASETRHEDIAKATRSAIKHLTTNDVANAHRPIVSWIVAVIGLASIFLLTPQAGFLLLAVKILSLWHLIKAVVGFVELSRTDQPFWGQAAGYDYQTGEIWGPALLRHTEEEMHRQIHRAVQRFGIDLTQAPRWVRETLLELPQIVGLDLLVGLAPIGILVTIPWLLAASLGLAAGKRVAAVHDIMLPIFAATIVLAASYTLFQRRRFQLNLRVSA
jgi:hypothetical protein